MSTIFRKFILSTSISKIQKLICVFASSFGLWKLISNQQQPEFIKSITAIFLFLFCFRFIKAPYKCHFNNKVIIYLFSAFLAISIVIGSIAIENSTVFENTNYMDMLSMIFAVLGIWVVIVNIAIYFNNFVLMYSINYFSKEKFDGSLFCILWILFLFLWFPYLLAYYPGHMSWDSTYQWMQAAGYIKMTNSHPILHTLLIVICQKIGGILSKDPNFQVAIYSFIQLSLMAAIFSYTITWLKRYNTPYVICCFVFIWYALHPIFGSYGIIMWKDVIFGCFVLLETLCIADIALSNCKCLKNIVFIVYWFIITILCSLFRHNGIYAIIFTLFLLPFVIKNKTKEKLSICCICFIIIIVSINNIIVKKYSGPGSVFLLSVPVQQISRTVAHNGNISDNDCMTIEKIASLESIKEKYVFWLSDPTVVLFSGNIKDVKKWQFFKLWCSIFLKNPGIYIDAFIYQTYGFWYPLDLSRSYIEKGINKDVSNLHNINLEIAYGSKSMFLSKILDNIFKISRLPGISIIWGIGAHIVLIIYCGIVFWIRGNKRLLSCLLPCISVWGTLLISTPIYIEWRYAFSFFTTLPVIAVLAFFKGSTDNKNQQGIT